MLTDFANWLDANLLEVAFFLPLFIGLLVRSTLSAKAKAIVMLVVTGVANLVAVKEGGAVIDGDTLIDWGKTILVTIATYLGLWKQLGLGNLKPDVGIGPETSGPGSHFAV